MLEVMAIMAIVFIIGGMQFLVGIVRETKRAQALSPQEYRFPEYYAQKDYPDFLKNGGVYYWYADPIRIRNGNFRIFLRSVFLIFLLHVLKNEILNYKYNDGSNEVIRIVLLVVFLSFSFFMMLKHLYFVFFCSTKPLFALSEKGFYFSLRKSWFFRKKFVAAKFNRYVEFSRISDGDYWYVRPRGGYGAVPFIFEYFKIEIVGEKDLKFVTDNSFRSFKDYDKVLTDVAGALRRVRLDYYYIKPRYVNQAYKANLLAWIILLLNLSEFVCYVYHLISCEIYSVCSSSGAILVYILLTMLNIIFFLLPYRWQIKAADNPKTPPLSPDIPPFKHSNFWKRIWRTMNAWLKST